VPTWAISPPLNRFGGFLTSSIAVSRPSRCRASGPSVGAGRNCLHAFAEDALRQNGSGGGAVAGNVLVLEATSRTSARPLFSSGSLSSISLATVTPSLVMFGPPNFFSRNYVAALGAKGDFHGVGELIDAAQNRLTDASE